MIDIDKACIKLGGTLSVQKKAVRIFDLNSNNVADLVVVDKALLSCSAGDSIYCGSDGCGIHFLAENNLAVITAQSWEFLKSKSGTQLMLLSLHGSKCNEQGTKVCYKALSFDKGTLIYQK